MKKIISFILAVVLVAACIVFIPRLVHSCDSCEKFFVGPGYEGNAVTDTLANKDQVLCKECAETYHALEITLGGKTVNDFMKNIFE